MILSIFLVAILFKQQQQFIHLIFFYMILYTTYQEECIDAFATV